MEKSETICPGPDQLDLITLETPGLGNRSYLVIADGWAVAVDVQRDLDRVQDILTARGVRLAAAVETHVHNDYVTGGLALARHWDADYIVPAGPDLAFRARRGYDGDRIHAGPLALRIINSPGHTDAHSSYSLHIGDNPAIAAFTGGSLLLGGTGRTDLLGAHRAAQLAAEQYWTARRLARLLPPDARLLPTHGFGSHCLAGEAAKSATDRLADQLEINPAYLLDEQDFVADMLQQVGPIPAYFPKMAPRNVAGPAAADLRIPTSLPLSAVAERATAGQTVIDVRPRADFAAGHVQGALSIDAAGGVATWTGWVTDIDSPLTVVAADPEQLAYVQRELSRIGVDRLAGAYTGPMEGQDVPLVSQSSATFPEVARRLRSRTETPLVDVRDRGEWAKGHLRGALHIPAQDILDAEVPEGPWLYCGVGFRASIAASRLARIGTASVVVDDALARAKKAGIAWCGGAQCPDDRCVAALLPVTSARR
jgi:glyoxylase-like metal-dependent hydrolase (beta-lactamase superfamily II)/rhodanese-related sulfurtransferase